MNVFTRPRNVCLITFALFWASMAHAQQIKNADPAISNNSPPFVEYSLDKSHTKLRFAIGHFVVFSKDGEFTDFDAHLAIQPQAPQLSAVSAVVSTASISTSDDDIDDHLKSADFFNVKKFPTASFRTIKVEGTGKKAKVIGELTLHGITKSVTFDVTLESAALPADVLNFNATTTFLRSDFGMNSFRPMVGNEVTLSIVGQFVKAVNPPSSK